MELIVETFVVAASLDTFLVDLSASRLETGLEQFGV